MSISLRPSTYVEVPESYFSGDVPLVAVHRGEHVGSLHRGIAAAVDVGGNAILSLGEIQQPAFLRSAAKPFQVMPALLTGAVDRYGITERELALLCASHSAEPRHTEAVLTVLAKAGLGEDALRCGIHPPMHQPTAERRIQAGVPPTPVCNNCSGAHTGMLLACKARGWSLDSYGDPHHPLQVMTREVLAQFTDILVDRIGYAIDNCAVPTFLLPIDRAAQAFARLASGQRLDPEVREAAARVVRAMTTYPEMVAGEERFDTDLMRVAQGSIVSKGGAEGFQGIGVVGSGVGIALKISDGNSRAVAPTAMRILGALGALEERQQRELTRYSRPEVHNHQDELVGRLEPVFHVGERA